MWSKTQSLVALSPGEREFYAALKASAEALGVLAIMKDLGWHMYGEVHGDASAALGIIHRKGLGRTRHIDTGLLWIQQTAAEKRLSYYKVLGAENPADLMTKYLSVENIVKHCQCLEIEFPGGRASTAPALHNVLHVRALWQEDETTDDDEGNPDELLTQLQKMVNEVWTRNWKRQTKLRANAKHDGDKDRDASESGTTSNLHDTTTTTTTKDASKEKTSESREGQKSGDKKPDNAKARKSDVPALSMCARLRGNHVSPER